MVSLIGMKRGFFWLKNSNHVRVIIIYTIGMLRFLNGQVNTIVIKTEFMQVALYCWGAVWEMKPEKELQDVCSETWFSQTRIHSKMLISCKVFLDSKHSCNRGASTSGYCDMINFPLTWQTTYTSIRRIIQNWIRIGEKNFVVSFPFFFFPTEQCVKIGKITA